MAAPLVQNDPAQLTTAANRLEELNNNVRQLWINTNQEVIQINQAGLKGATGMALARATQETNDEVQRHIVMANEFAEGMRTFVRRLVAADNGSGISGLV